MYAYSLKNFIKIVLFFAIFLKFCILNIHFNDQNSIEIADKIFLAREETSEQWKLFS